MTADKHYYILAAHFSGGNIFLLRIMFKEVPQTLYAAVKQKRTTRNLWSVFIGTCIDITLRNVLTFSHPFGRNWIYFSKEINKPLTSLVNCILERNICFADDCMFAPVLHLFMFSLQLALQKYLLKAYRRLAFSISENQVNVLL